MVLCCLFWCQCFDEVSPYVCSYYFSSVWVAELPSFVKELLTGLTICSLYSLTICNFSYLPFCFEGLIWFLIASVPGLCIFFIFTKSLNGKN